jgi:hypothetical protein
MPHFDFDGAYAELMEHQKDLAEGKSKRLTVSGIKQDKLKSLLKAANVDAQWSGDNVTISKGYEKISGYLMLKKGEVLSVGTKTSESVLDESIKTDLDNLKADKMERKGKLVTLTWKSGDVDEIKQKLNAAMKAHKDTIKHSGAEKDGNGVKVEIEMK